MDTGIDTGDMIKKAVVLIDKKETGESLFQKLSKIGGPLMLEVLDELENGTAVFEKQEEAQACYVKKLEKETGRILWSDSAERISCLVRGLNSWPSAYTTLNEKIVKIWEAEVYDQEWEGNCGEIVKVEKNRFLVKTGQGTLGVLEVQLEGKKRMKTDAFLRGYPLQVGIQLK